jgi:arylsulfatase
LPKWETLSPDQKKLFARQAEVYAAFAAYTDYEIGRVVQKVRDMGEEDNTIFIYIVGDNGTSPEGTLSGTPNQWLSYNGVLDFPIAEQLKFYDAWGSVETYPHMAVAWSWAFDTPFQYTKQIASHFGGTRQGMVISWPGHINDPGGVRNQFHHFIDIVPTLYDVTGIPAPEYVNGVKQKPVEGISMAYTFDKANANAPSHRKVQYFEMIANRGIYKDGWYANTTPPHGPWILNAPLPEPKDYKWELYNLAEDYSQSNDLAAVMPEKLKEMQAAFDEEAKKYNVLPLNNDTFARAVAPRPSPTAGQTEFTYSGVVTGLDTASTPNVIGRSYTVTAEVTVPQGGGSGVIATSGGRWGGYGLYVLNGRPVFNYNMLILNQYQWAGKDAMTPGKHTIVFDYVYDGPGIAKGGSGTLKVDGKVVATGKQDKSIAFLPVSDETFDVGLDTRSSVNEADYKVPFPFTGTIEKLAFKLGPLQIISPAQQAAMAKKIADAKD